MRMGLERMPGEASGEKGGGHWGVVPGQLQSRH